MEPEQVSTPEAHQGWRVPIGLVCVVAILSLTRLPSVWYRMGGQDEQWYSVPGWTVAREGIPRIPYVPVEDKIESVFEGAHRILYALPPAYFYSQTPFFWLFPAGYGTARLAAWVAGIGSLLALFLLMRLLRVPPWYAVTGLLLCGLGRAFFFPWQDTRPDMLCAAFGLASIVCVLLARQRCSRGWVAMAGVFVGLGGLTHPYALNFAIQVAMLLLLFRQPFTIRIQNCLLAGGIAVAMLALWLPLILLDVDAFQSQFVRNVLSRSGPGIVSRLLWPWSFVEFQAKLIVERMGSLQFGIVMSAIAVGLVIVMCDRWVSKVRPRSSDDPIHTLRLTLLLATSAFYLHIASLGLHPAKGYLCYPWALTALLVVAAAYYVLKLGFERRWQPWSRIGVGLVLLTMLLMEVPGSGLCASWTYATRNNQVNYNRQTFCRQLDTRFPPDARLLVSPEYVFEFEILGRKPINASLLKIYHSVEGLPFDYLIASTQAFDERIAERLNCELIWMEGDPDDPLACFVKVYVPTEDSPRSLPWPR